MEKTPRRRSALLQLFRSILAPWHPWSWPGGLRSLLPTSPPAFCTPKLFTSLQSPHELWSQNLVSPSNMFTHSTTSPIRAPRPLSPCPVPCCGVCPELPGGADAAPRMPPSTWRCSKAPRCCQSCSAQVPIDPPVPTLRGWCSPSWQFPIKCHLLPLAFMHNSEAPLKIKFPRQPLQPE